MATSSSMQAQVAAAHGALARNLLSSVLALAFPDNLATDALAQRDFLAQVPQLRALFAQHNVFDFVTEGKAFDKFHARLFQLIDNAQGVGRTVKSAAFELLLVVVEQCPLDALEALLPKLTERVLKMVKYIKDAPLVVAGACDVARVLVRHVDVYSPETRRDAHDWISKLLPASVALLLDLSNKSGALRDDEVTLFASAVDVFTELLHVSPSAVRSTLSKLEGAVVNAALYNSVITSNAQASLSAARCLASISNASDKSNQMWKQVVDRAVEMAHQLVDPVAGKRTVTATPPTGMKSWLRGETANATADVSALAVYQRAQVLLQRVHFIVSVLEEAMKNRSISEREVQLVINDVVLLSRRIVTVRAHEVGKQSAISEDGFRLPVSVVYGTLPQIHALGLRCISACISRAGICALRHASKVAKTLMLALENVHADAHTALYGAVSTCVRVLGASTLKKLGQPLLEHLVAQCKQDLLHADKAKKAGDGDEKPTAVAEGKGGKNNKGKKRKRAVGDLSQLAVDGANGAAGSAVFLSTHNQRMLVGNVDAALEAIATCVAVYGSLLPADTRSLASEVALLSIQQQAKRRAMRASPTPANGLDNVALMLLTDAVSADANGAHATNLVKSLRYWSSPNCSPSLLQLISSSAGEALVHPRAPPLSIDFSNAVQAHAAASTSATSSVFGASSVTERPGAMVPAAAAVRGQLDWDREEGQQQQEVPTEPESEETVADAVAKRAKIEDDVEEDATMGEEAKADEEDEEEDYDDERPASTEETATDEAMEEDEEKPVASTTAAVAAPSTANDDEDDDEFPDIVVDDEDDE